MIRDGIPDIRHSSRDNGVVDEGGGSRPFDRRRHTSRCIPRPLIHSELRLGSRTLGADAPGAVALPQKLAEDRDSITAPKRGFR